MTLTWAVIAAAAGALGLLFWRYYVRPYLFPMEGVEKVAFVILAWGIGGCLLGLAPTVVYALPCALIGLLLLALGSLVGLPPILRYWQERRELRKYVATRLEMSSARPESLSERRAA